MAYLFQSGSVNIQLSGGMNLNYSDLETKKQLAVLADGVTPASAGGVLALGADGASSDGSLYWDGSALCVGAAGNKTAHFDGTGLDLVSGDAYLINNTSVLNATTLGGDVVDSSLTSLGTQGEALDMGDYAIQNVGDIDCDSVSVADATAGLSIDFSAGSETGNQKILIPDNLASGLDITQGDVSYLKFATTNGSELITFGKDVDINGGNVDGTAIGVAAQSSVQATTLSGSSTLMVGGAASLADDLSVLGSTVLDDHAQLNATLQVAGNASFNGSVVLGNAAVDGVAISGSVITSIIPAANDADDVGSSSNQWRNLYVTNVKANTLSGSSTLDVDGAAQFNSTLDVEGAAQFNSAFSIKVDQDIDMGLTTDDAFDQTVDGIYYSDNDDSGLLKMQSISTFLTAIAGAGMAVSESQLTTEANVVVNSHGDANANLELGMNWSSAVFSANRVWTLPALIDFDNGDIIRVKAPPLAGYSLTVATNASDKIDDLNDGIGLELNSDNASISLMKVDATMWKIF